MCIWVAGKSETEYVINLLFIKNIIKTNYLLQFLYKNFIYLFFKKKKKLVLRKKGFNLLLYHMSPI